MKAIRHCLPPPPSLAWPPPVVLVVLGHWAPHLSVRPLCYLCWKLWGAPRATCRVHVSRCRVSVELLTVYTTPRPSHNCQPVLHGPWLPWAQCRHQPTLHTTLRLQQLKSRQICKHHDVRPFHDLPPKIKPKVRKYISVHISTQVHLHNLSICGSELEMFVWLKSVAKTSSHCFVKDGNHKLQRTTETHFWQHGEIASR